jgi:hypothetical protein
MRKRKSKSKSRYSYCNGNRYCNRNRHGISNRTARLKALLAVNRNELPCKRHCTLGHRKWKTPPVAQLAGVDEQIVQI